MQMEFSFVKKLELPQQVDPPYLPSSILQGTPTICTFSTSLIFEDTIEIGSPVALDEQGRAYQATSHQIQDVIGVAAGKPCPGMINVVMNAD